MKSATFNRWTRLALTGQVALLVGLTLIAVLLVIEVAEWPAARVRIDATIAESSSLDPATAAILQALPERAEVDLFYRVPTDFAEGYVDALDRTRRLLRRAESQVPDALSVRIHDANDLVRAKGRMDELRVTAADISFATPVGMWLGALVVKVGERRTVVRLVPDVCLIDLGDPRRAIPSSVSSWRGEEALCEGLGRIAGGAAPRVAFAQGHNERGPVVAANDGVLDLTRALENSGFEISVWDGSKDGPVPSDVDVLVIAGPDQLYSRAASTAVREHLARGGRLICTLGDVVPVGEGSLPELLEGFGARLVPGIVCEPVYSALLGDYVDGKSECASVVIGPEDLASAHPVTAPLRASGLRAPLDRSLSFQRGAPPMGGTLVELVNSPEEAWRDLPALDDGHYDFTFERGREQLGRFPLAVAVEWPTTNSKRAKVLALGSTYPLTVRFENWRPFLMNTFEWLVDRDFRVRIAPKSTHAAVLDRSRSSLRAAVSWTGMLAFPALCVLLGTVLVVRRRR